MKNKIKIIILLVVCSLLTGCTTYLKDENKAIIKNPTTGQNITKNILCKPQDNEIVSIYQKYNETAESKVDIEKLPSCSVLTPMTGKYEGLWTTLFVKSLAWIIIKFGEIFKSYGISIIFVTVLIRAIMFPFTKKTAMQSENLKEAQKDLDRLEKKYQNKNDQESMMQKSQEMMIIYKKYNINPISGCLFAFIQIPLFFAFYEAINRIPVIFEENFLGLFQLGTSPAIALFTNHQYYYVILIVLIALATYYSFKLNGTAMSQEQAGQMKTMTNIMVIFMTITAFSISSGIAIYWIVSNVFTIIQNLYVKKTRGVKHA